MKENKFMHIFSDCEAKYEGQIKKVLNEAKISMSEADDKYLKGKANKYKLQIINEADKKVKAITDQYLQDCANLFDSEAAKLNTPVKDTRDNATKLLDEISKMNKMKELEMDMAVMHTGDLIEAANYEEDSFRLKCMKYELMKRADKEEDPSLATQVRNIVGYGPQIQLDECKVEMQNMILNKDSILPGMSLGEKMKVKNTKDWLMKDVDITESYNEVK